MLFDNANENISLPDIPALHIDNNGIVSVSAWIYMVTGAGSGQYSLIFGDWDAGPAFYIVRHTTTTSWDIRYWTTGVAKTLTTITAQLSTWYHLAWVKNGMSLKFYLNGVLKNTVTDSVYSTRNPTNVVLGGSGSDNLYGRLDEVGLWNRALSDNEVLTLYNNGNALSYCKNCNFGISIDVIN